MRSFTLSVVLLGALALVALAPDRASAQYYVMTPGSSYYYTPTYVTPSMYTVPRVSYYYGPTGMTYYTTPAYTYYPGYTYYPTYTSSYGYWPTWRYRRGWVYTY